MQIVLKGPYRETNTESRNKHITLLYCYTLIEKRGDGNIT